MKLINEALSNNQFTEFLIGEGKYARKIPAEYGEEPNFYSYWWRNEIEPFFNSNDKDILVEAFNSSIEELIDYSKDTNLGIYTLLAHILQYYYSLNISKRIKEYWDITDEILRIKKTIYKNKNMLISDKRWSTGNLPEEKNLGLWGIIVHKCNLISKYGGPDFLGNDNI